MIFIIRIVTKWLSILVITLLPCNASYYYADSSYGASSSSNMSLSTFEPDSMHDFITSKDDMPEDSEVPDNWYKLDKNSKELKKVKNYQNNILRIIIEEIADQFADQSDDRNETLQKILEYLNNFIDTHYIPRDYHKTISAIYRYVTDLQNIPKFNAAAIIYKELSDQAKQAFKDGRRVQTSGLDRDPNNNQQDGSVSYKADPLLLEVLFLTMVVDAQKTVKKRQELLDIIDKKMQKIENVFGNDSAYGIVGNFDSIRSALLEFAQAESPIPALFNHILGMIKNTKERKELEKQYADNLKADDIPDITTDDLRILSSSGKTKTRENLWQKIVKSQQNQADDDTDNYDEDGNLIHKKKKKKKGAKGFLENIEQKVISNAEATGESFIEGNADQSVQGLLGKVSQSLKGILPHGTKLPGLTDGSGIASASDNIGGFNLGSMFG